MPVACPTSVSPSIAAFGIGKRTYDLSIHNALLQRSIARAATFQNFPAVISRFVEAKPSRVLKVLEKKLRANPPEPWNVSVRRRDGGGHALTPYAIEDMGGGISHVHVYDSNWPGDQSRRVIVDRKKEIWSYYGATLPDIDQAEFDGDAKTKSFRLKPVGPGLGVQPCPFCTGRKGAKLKRNAISLSSVSRSHSRLLLIDGRGRRTGFVKGRLVNRIPGVTVIHPETGLRFASRGAPRPILDSSEPIYMVPRGLRLRIKVTGRNPRPVASESVNVAGPSFDASVDRLRAARGRPVVLELAPRRSTLRVIGAGQSRGMSARVGTRGRNATYQVGFDFDDAGPRSRWKLVRDHRRRTLRLNLFPSASQDLGAFIVRFDGRKRTRFEADYTLHRGERAGIRFGPALRGSRGRLVIHDRSGDLVRSLPLTEVADD